MTERSTRLRIENPLDLVINPATEESTKGSTPLSGASTAGQTVLTLANTWYAVPVTAPTSAYVLVATPETSVGIIRWSFTNTGTPSTTNGNFAAGHLTMKLAAGQLVYFGSSSGADSVNFTTKII